MINWTATAKETEKIIQIAKRVASLSTPSERGQLDLIMDIEATHCNGCPLDLDTLLTFDDFNLLHDIYGIIKHLDRASGKLKNCFFPRCAK